jgi:hypothetical protein
VAGKAVRSFTSARTRSGGDYRDHTREQAEVMVETVTVLASRTVGLALRRVRCVRGGLGAIGALEAASRFAETIDRIAGHIEDALLASDEPPETLHGPRRQP